jgi:hypothetical protein
MKAIENFCLSGVEIDYSVSLMQSHSHMIRRCNVAHIRRQVIGSCSSITDNYIHHKYSFGLKV